MELLHAYNEIHAKINRVQFNLLWQGFLPFKFALYDDKQVCFGGKLMPKTDEFLGNTSIVYKGENIAIWKLTQPFDTDILASKVIHEMFHAFQKQFKNLEYANEFEATFKYNYSTENISIKHQENILLAELSTQFSTDKFDKFCALRAYRANNFAFEVDYENKIELIEGTANFVELCALKQLSFEKYQQKLDKMIANLNDIDNLIPVRIISYDVGALIIKTLVDNELTDNLPADKYFLTYLSKKITTTPKIYTNEEITQKISNYYQQTRQMIQSAISRNEKIEIANAHLVGYNIYNARFCEGYLLTTYFLMCNNSDNQVVLHGDFVVKIDDNYNIQTIYKTKLDL